MVRFRTLLLELFHSPKASAVAQTGAVVPLVKFNFGACMGPAQRKPLLDSLQALTQLQIEAIKDATYIGWTEDSLRAYGERWRIIAEIHAKLR